MEVTGSSPVSPTISYTIIEIRLLNECPKTGDKKEPVFLYIYPHTKLTRSIDIESITETPFPHIIHPGKWIRTNKRAVNEFAQKKGIDNFNLFKINPLKTVSSIIGANTMALTNPLKTTLKSNRVPFDM